MLKMKIIEPSRSNWASPIVLVKKTDGSERFCVDYRKVNMTTVKDCFPMPNIEQIKLTERAKQISSFICSRGLFKFRMMPFGLCNAGATFQRIMEFALNGLTNSTAYIDDILTYSKNFEEHLTQLEELLKRLKGANIKVKTSKCKIASSETTFLGFKISSQGMSILDNRIEAIKKYPKPTSGKKVKEFLGLASYYRQFIHNFSNIVDPLNKLTRKNEKFKWTPDCDKAFESIIKSLTTKPILGFPNFSKTFYLSTDASNVGIGAVLSQKDNQDRERVIFYASRSLNQAERNYSTKERELLGIVYAVEKFKYYLHGTEFIIYTDHHPLTYLNNITLSSSRLTRWRLKLAEYNFKIIYKKGSINTNADALSRIDEPNTQQVYKEDLIETLLNINQESHKDNMKYLDSAS